MTTQSVFNQIRAIADNLPDGGVIVFAIPAPVDDGPASEDTLIPIHDGLTCSTNEPVLCITAIVGTAKQFVEEFARRNGMCPEKLWQEVLSGDSLVATNPLPIPSQN